MITAIDAYKQAFSAYRQGFKPFALNGIMLLAFTFVGAVISTAVSLVPTFGGIAVLGEQSQWMWVVVMVSTVLSLLVALATSIFVKAYYGVCQDVRAGRKVGALAFFQHGKGRFRTLFGITLAQMLSVMALVTLFAILPAALLSSAVDPALSPFLTVIFVLVAIPFLIAAAALFEPAYPVAFMEGTGAIPSIKRGIVLIRKDIKQYAILTVFSFLAEIMNFIPAAQQIVTIPLNSCAMLIYLEGLAGPSRKAPAVKAKPVAKKKR